MAAKRSYDLGSATDVGRKRTENEDRLDIFEPQDQGQLAQKGSLYIVADGMGGHEAGAVASDRAVRKIIDEYYYGSPNLRVRESLENAIRVANAETFRLAAQKPDWGGMGATVVAAIVRGEELQIANVGDSRALLFRPGERPRQLSVDHTVVGELVREGKMTPEEAARSPRRHQITRSLGRRPDVAVELAPPEKFLPGDALVLCSDGLTDMLSSEEIRAVVSQFPAQAAASKLVAQANARGGVDNISVIVLKRPVTTALTAEVPTVVGKKPSLPLWIPILLSLAAISILVLVVLRFSGLWRSRKPPVSAPGSPTATLLSGVAETLFPTVTSTPPRGPTSTLVPTETAVSPTHTPTRVPAPQGLIYAAPVLEEPVDGAPISSLTLHLRWSWNRALKADETFELWVGPRDDAGRFKQSLRSADATITPPGGVGVYYWKVRVIRGEVGKPGAIPLSEWSRVRSFDYQWHPLPAVTTAIPSLTSLPQPTVTPRPTNPPSPAPLPTVTPEPTNSPSPVLPPTVTPEPTNSPLSLPLPSPSISRTASE